MCSPRTQGGSTTVAIYILCSPRPPLFSFFLFYLVLGSECWQTASYLICHGTISYCWYLNFFHRMVIHPLDGRIPWPISSCLCCWLFHSTYLSKSCNHHRSFICTLKKNYFFNLFMFLLLHAYTYTVQCQMDLFVILVCVFILILILHYFNFYIFKQ